MQANALQPSATTVFFSDFEADNGGFTAGGTNSSWTWGVPTSGPSAAYSGSKLWATNLAGNYNNSENSYIVSPTIDLSAYFGNNVVVAWWQWINTENAFDTVFVDVTNDGGTTWYQLYYFSGSATGWAQESFTLDPIFITAGFAIRFRMESDPDTVYEGFYVDDVAVNVEQVSTPILFWLPLISKNP
jgi:bacillopeptidase F